MERNEMIQELLQQLETELEELNNSQLSALQAEYEHSQILGSVIELLSFDSNADEDDDEEKEDEDLSLVDSDWEDSEDNE